MSLDARRKLAPIAIDSSRELRKRLTSAEEMFWDRVRNRKFLGLKFRRQHPLFVDDRGRETFYVADFYCHEKRLIVELDGRSHDGRESKDAERERLIREYGIRVKRFKNSQIEKDIENVMRQMEEHISELC